MEITCPESLCVTFCDRHYGVGADGIILMERSRKADAKMTMYNADGSRGRHGRQRPAVHGQVSL